MYAIYLKLFKWCILWIFSTLVISREACQKSPWLKCIKMTLDEINQSYLWNESPQNIDHVQLKSLFDKELKSKYSQQWLDQMQSPSTCSTYSIFKQNLQFEPYLLKLKQSLAIPLCKLRCINHRLPVIAERYSNIPRAEGICNLCTDGEVGDKFHYIFNCSHFDKERSQFINRKYMNGANISIIKLQNTCLTLKLNPNF